MLPPAEACGSCFGESWRPGEPPLHGVLGVVGVAGCCFDVEVALAPVDRGGEVFVLLDAPAARGSGMCEPAGFEDEFHTGCCSLCLPLTLPLPLAASLDEARV